MINISKIRRAWIILLAALVLAGSIPAQTFAAAGAGLMPGSLKPPAAAESTEGEADADDDAEVPEEGEGADDGAEADDEAEVPEEGEGDAEAPAEDADAADEADAEEADGDENADVPEEGEGADDAEAAGSAAETTVPVTDGTAGFTDLTGLPDWPAPPEISAASVYMFEKNSNTVLFARDPDAESFPASTTKIMTALLTLEHCDLDETVTFSHDAIYDIEDGGHHYEFEEGEVLTVDECLQFLMVESVNEVGYALAEHIAGSVSAFADMMNARAKELGCTHTHFVNPHGLNDPEHVTTAKDMALILSKCVENEDFIRYSSQTSVKLSGRVIRTDGFSRYTNHHLMLQPESEYYYPDVVCGKTGFTSLAGNTLVTYASRDGMDVVCVLMKGLSDRFEDTRLLLDYAFNDFKYVTKDNIGEVIPSYLDGIDYPAEDVEVPDVSLVVPDLADEEHLHAVYEARGTVPTDEDRSVGTLTFTFDSEQQGTFTLGSADVMITDDAFEVLEEKLREESRAAALEDSGEGGEDTFVPEKEYLGWTVKEMLFVGGLFLLLAILLAILFVLIGERLRWGRAERRRRRR